MKYFAVALIGSLLFQPSPAPSQAQAPKVFLLEDVGSNHWCSYTIESKWKTKAREVRAMTVGTLTYSTDHLTQIDVTGTDESGDWTVYDHHFLDADRRICKALAASQRFAG